VIPNALAESVPFKWRKYLLLVQHGLTSGRELLADVRRYQDGHVGALLADIKEEFRVAAKARLRLLVVVKIVPLNEAGLLPNHRLTSARQIRGLERFLRGSQRGCELWYCKTTIDNSIFSVAGRIIMLPQEPLRAQIVEQVWRCSPRLIEQFNAEFAWPYVRGVRPGWGWRHEVEHLQDGTTLVLGRLRLEAEFRSAMGIIERARYLLEPFCDLLGKYHFAAFSLEYKVVGSKLHVIDWDTPDDTTVLRHEAMRLL
jgi:hypothetical protein